MRLIPREYSLPTWGDSFSGAESAAAPMQRFHKNTSRSKAKKGTVTFCLWRSRLFKKAAVRAVSTCILRDISERKQAEEALRESRERLDLALSHREWPRLTGTSSRTSVAGVTGSIACWEPNRRPSPETAEEFFQESYIRKTGAPCKRPCQGRRNDRRVRDGIPRGLARWSIRSHCRERESSSRPRRPADSDDGCLLGHHRAQERAGGGSARDRGEKYHTLFAMSKAFASSGLEF